jgi:L-alanine-DL-glutamate epimerase-like enolase superfamily enzyme
MGGFAEPDYDLRRIARVRNTVGDGVAIGLDVNGAWSLAESRAVLPRLLEIGTAFVEEPWAYELGMQGFDELPAEHPALALGEISASVIELQSLARTEYVQYIRADVTLLGGEQQWLALSETIASTGASLYPHFWPDLHRHLAATAPTAYIEDLLPGGGEFGLERFVRSEPALADGMITAPSAPGFGFHLDWEAVAALAVVPPTIRHRAGERIATGG